MIEALLDVNTLWMKMHQLMKEEKEELEVSDRDFRCLSDHNGRGSLAIVVQCYLLNCAFSILVFTNKPTVMCQKL